MKRIAVVLLVKAVFWVVCCAGKQPVTHDVCTLDLSNCAISNQVFERICACPLSQQIKKINFDGTSIKIDDSVLNMLSQLEELILIDFSAGMNQIRGKIECSICKEAKDSIVYPFSCEESENYPQGHPYCQSCADRWISSGSNRTCPCCHAVEKKIAEIIDLRGKYLRSLSGYLDEWARFDSKFILKLSMNLIKPEALRALFLLPAVQEYLIELELGRNGLKELPAEISLLCKLQRLSVSMNLINDKAFQRIFSIPSLQESLQSLNVCDNEFGKFALESVTKLRNLKYLRMYVGADTVTNIPDSWINWVEDGKLEQLCLVIRDYQEEQRFRLKINQRTGESGVFAGARLLCRVPCALLYLSSNPDHDFRIILA